ncbi:four helix bundle protein [Mucilaginibacter sp. RS28]|uniref:Four helix bundle protein n=1 Tax=Mucilaginibacter straminoryzae TaxID=2932774 RepID=A0A9X1X5A8_9SPHI|nr:four helix bundle protein [Mucilaginibacter straminoryzae]MCJ8210680.1 four helix bundle protein [Mucilaginibacter straminoryzae]
MKHNFKNLKVWQKAMDLTDLTYSYCKGLPSDERFNLIDQINRSSVSIPSNIAEGSGKRTNLHTAEFLSTSLTSSYELETQLLICKRRGYGQPEKLENCLALLEEVQKMVFSFREHVLSKDKETRI